MAAGTVAPRMRFAFERERFAEGRAEGEAVGRAEGEAVGRAEGEAVGLAKAVLEALHARAVQVPAPFERKIRECGDQEQLLAWVHEAVTAERIEDLSNL